MQLLDPSAPSPPLQAVLQGFEPAPWRDPLWHRARHTLWLATELQPVNLTAEAAAWQRPEAVSTLLACAEFHGMAPLLAHHLHSTSLPALRRPLAALAARHRRVAAARQQVLSALIAGCAERGIAMLLLKGAALAHTVYPTPVLRPMRDVDVLIEPAAVPAMLALLAAQGFVPAGDRPPPGHHHLPGQLRHWEGVPVHLEVHTHLGLSRRCALPNAALFAAAVPCRLGAVQGRMPAPPHLLWHAVHHGFAMPFTTEASKLIWYADLRAMVSAWWALPGFADAPKMRRILRQLEATRPWPATVGLPGQARTRLAVRDYAGWPRAALGQGPWQQRLHAWHATLLPPRFWLGMRHGIELGRWAWLQAWVLHLRDLGQKVWAGLWASGSGRRRAP